MSELPDQYVKRGFWIDWSHGRVLGSTITVEATTGQIIVALTAVLVSLATGHLWNILVFLVHQLRASKTAEDGLFRQQQVLLRSMPTPGSATVDFFKLGWVWRRKARGYLIRNLVPTILAGAYGLLALTASVTSSFIVDAGTIAVLVASSECAWENLPYDYDGWSSADVGRTLGVPEVVEYTRICTGRSEIPASCSIFVRPRVSISIASTPCPFPADLCNSTDLGVVLDTGMIDVNEVLGINTAPEDQVFFRKVTTCAPLTLREHTSHFALAEVPQLVLNHDPSPDETAVGFNFGSSYSRNTSRAESLTPRQSEVLANMTSWSSEKVAEGSYGFQLFMYTYYDQYNLGELSGQYHPLPGLTRPHADLSLSIMTTNAVYYQHQVDDPVFLATRETNDTVPGDGLREPVYASDYAGGATVCLFQYQFCASQAGSLQCNNLTSISPDGSISPLPQANLIQQAVMKMMQRSAYIFDYGTISSVTPPVLNASWSSSDNLREAVPHDQWQTEVYTWESCVWTGLRSLLPKFAMGNVTGGVGYPLTVNTTGERQLCGMIKMNKPGGFANVNVFGLSLIVASACSFLILDVTGVRFLIFLRRFRPTLAPRIKDWIQDGIYQLQRKVYEARGEGSWTRLGDEIPLTLGQLSNTATDKPLSSGLVSSGRLTLPASSTSQTRESASSQYITTMALATQIGSNAPGLLQSTSSLASRYSQQTASAPRTSASPTGGNNSPPMSPVVVPQNAASPAPVQPSQSTNLASNTLSQALQTFQAAPTFPTPLTHQAALATSTALASGPGNVTAGDDIVCQPSPALTAVQTEVMTRSNDSVPAQIQLQPQSGPASAASPRQSARQRPVSIVVAPSAQSESPLSSVSRRTTN